MLKQHWQAVRWQSMYILITQVKAANERLSFSSGYEVMIAIDTNASSVVR